MVDEVYFGRSCRVLYTLNPPSAQSAAPLNRGESMVFGYNRRFMEIFEACKPKRVLVIGGGVFTLPSEMVSQSGDVVVTAIEPEKMLIKIAKKHFNFQETERLKVVTDFGGSFLKQDSSVYDLIILDAFSGNRIASEIIGSDFALLLKEHLSDNGLVGVNVISNLETGSILSRIKNNYEKQLAYTAIYAAETTLSMYLHADNYILLASQKRLPRLNLSTERVHIRI